MWAWRSVSSLLNDETEAPHKASTVLLLHSPRTDSFPLSLWRPPPLSSQASAICRNHRPNRTKWTSSLPCVYHVSPSFCIILTDESVAKGWLTFWLCRYKNNTPSPQKQQKNRKERGSRGCSQTFSTLIALVRWLMESPDCEPWLCSSPNKVICHHPKDWPDRQQ